MRHFLCFWGKSGVASAGRGSSLTGGFVGSWGGFERAFGGFVGPPGGFVGGFFPGFGPLFSWGWWLWRVYFFVFGVFGVSGGVDSGLAPGVRGESPA